MNLWIFNYYANIPEFSGVRASYYFGLSTLDFEFMKEIENLGSEASVLQIY